MGFSASTKAAVSHLKGLAKVPSKIARAVATRLDNRYRDMFANERDPYGRPWAPLKASTLRRKGGNSVVLYRTGALNAETSVTPAAGSGVKIKLGPAAIYAQEGDPGRNRPPRLLLPSYGLPATWRQDIRTEAEAAVKGAR